MCGIAGIIPLNGNDQNIDDWLGRLTKGMAHRGPDGMGTYSDDHVGLAHHLLSITGKQGGNKQPYSLDEDLVIVYNGEIYNYPELRAQLEQKGYQFRTQTDTEVLYRAYQRHGISCNYLLSGMWAYAFYDKRKRQVILSRDRFGIKPLYYTIHNGQFLFCSEIKQLKLIPGFIFRANHRTITQFAGSGMLNYCEETLFDGIYELPPGHNLTISLDTKTYTLERWYELPVEEEQDRISYKEAVHRFSGLFDQVIKEHTPAEVPFGAFLSGGMDSSAIVDRLAAGDQHPFKTISFCFHEQAYNEERYIDLLARNYRLDAVKLKPELAPLFPDLVRKCIEAQDQPITGFSHALEYMLLSSANKQGLTVMLDGQGADEILAGYAPFRSLYNRQQIRKGQMPGMLSAADSGQSFFKGLMYSLFFRYPFHQRHPVVQVFKPLHSARWIRKDQREFMQYKIPALKTNSTAGMSHFMLMYELPYLLHSLDHNAMAHHIEARVPFLDHRLVELAVTLPDRFKIDNHTQKKVLRDVFKTRLPPQILGRKQKMGFVAPDARLLSGPGVKGELKQCISGLVDRMPGIFEKGTGKDNTDHLFKNSSTATQFRLLSLGYWAAMYDITYE